MVADSMGWAGWAFFCRGLGVVFVGRCGVAGGVVVTCGSLGASVGDVSGGSKVQSLRRSMAASATTLYGRGEERTSLRRRYHCRRCMVDTCRRWVLARMTTVCS